MTIQIPSNSNKLEELIGRELMTQYYEGLPITIAENYRVVRYYGPEPIIWAKYILKREKNYTRVTRIARGKPFLVNMDDVSPFNLDWMKRNPKADDIYSRIHYAKLKPHNIKNLTTLIKQIKKGGEIMRDHYPPFARLTFWGQSRNPIRVLEQWLIEEPEFLWYHLFVVVCWIILVGPFGPIFKNYITTSTLALLTLILLKILRVKHRQDLLGSTRMQSSGDKTT